MIGIRTGYDGTNYPSAGDAGRNQISKSNEYIDNIRCGILQPQMIWEQGAITGDGDSVSTKHIRTNMIMLVKEPLNFEIDDGYTLRVKGYTDNTGSTLSYTSGWLTGNNELYNLSPSLTTKYFRLDLTTVNGTIDISPSAQTHVKVFFRVPRKSPYIVVGSSTLSDENTSSCDYVCNGENDEIVINKAIQSLPITGGTVHLSRGLFKITSAIQLDRPINFEGEGCGLTLNTSGEVNVVGTTIHTDNNLCHAVEVINSLYSHKGFKIHDIQFSGVGLRNIPAKAGIAFLATSDTCSIYNCDINNFAIGIYAKDSYIDAINITNNSIQRNRLGVYMNNIDQSRIENNIIWDSYGIYKFPDLFSGTINCGGIAIKGNNNIISGNTFGRPSFTDEGNNYDNTNNAPYGRCALHLFGGSTSIIESNIFTDGFMSLIQISNCYGCLINGNSFRKYGYPTFTLRDRKAINITSAHKTMISTNLFYAQNSSDYQESGVVYDDSNSSDTVCTGNVSFGMTSQTIYNLNGINSTETGNVCK